MENGELFKHIRQDKGLTLRQLTDEQNSLSFISKFENGEHDITMRRFEHLLDKINVTIEEFYFLKHQSTEGQTAVTFSQIPAYLSSPFYSYLDRILHINAQIDSINDPADFTDRYITAKKQLEKVASELKATSQWQRFLRLYIQLLQQIYDINMANTGFLDNLDNQLSATQFDIFFKRQMADFRQISLPIVSYLYKVENWSIYEVTLFRFFLFTFSMDTIIQLLPIALKRITKMKDFTVMNDMRCELIFSAVSTFANFNQLKAADDALSLAYDTLNDSKDLLNSNQLVFYNGWIDILKGHKKTGTKKCQSAITIFAALNQPKLAKSYQNMLKHILLKSQNKSFSTYFS